MRRLLPIITIFAALVIWEISVAYLNIPVYLLPAPTLIAGQLMNPEISWVEHTAVTIYEVVVGFALALIVGIGLAIALSASKLFRAAFYPLILIAQLVPKIAIAPIILIWLGFGDSPKILIAFLIAFFPIVIDTSTGLNTVSPEVMDMVRAMRAPRWRIYAKIRLPAALVHIFGGMKVAMTLAVIGAVVAEFLGAEKGLGYLLFISGTYANTPMGFAALLILTLAGMMLYALILIVERLAIPWYFKPREEKLVIN